MHLAGGYIGYAVSGPLSSALTTWAAVALLTLLALYGLLLISGTTVHRIPERFRRTARDVRARQAAARIRR